MALKKFENKLKRQGWAPLMHTIHIKTPKIRTTVTSYQISMYNMIISSLLVKHVKQINNHTKVFIRAWKPWKIQIYIIYIIYRVVTSQSLVPAKFVKDLIEQY